MRPFPRRARSACQNVASKLDGKGKPYIHQKGIVRGWRRCEAALTVLLLAVIANTAVLAEPALVSDPNFPLIQLPAEFDSHRTTKRVNLPTGQEVKLLDVKVPGCVRHFWITANVPEALEIEITCDGAEQSLVKMSLHQFFGVLLGQEPYRIESVPIKLLPKNGYNSYFPIPFQSSCQITLRNTGKKNSAVWSMVNWQKFESNVTVTPYRLHAVYSEEKPAESLGTTLLGSIGGKGFVAGMFHAIRRHDMRDMIWHTGGDTWLIDGETNPHVLRGLGTEDVFGHSFGVYKDQSQWMGGVYAVGESRDCAEIVAYRFFGIDSVAFKSSMVLRFGTRSNDVESVLYYYKQLGKPLPSVESPKRWTISGPFEVSDYEQFQAAPLPPEVMNREATESNLQGRKLTPVQIESEHAWVDFVCAFRRNRTGNTGTQPDQCAAYARTVIASPKKRTVTLQLGCDDWMKVWLNGKPVGTLRHDNGFAVSKIPVTLESGDNNLVIRLSNFDNVEWRCWAFSCVVKDRVR